MHCMAYTSQSSRKLDDGEIFSILATSARNNSKSNVSGFLLYIQGNFFQFLEGECGDVTETFQRISKDDRHQMTKVVESVPANRRVFGKWFMKRIRVYSELDMKKASEKLSPMMRGSPMLEHFEAFLAANGTSPNTGGGLI